MDNEKYGIELDLIVNKFKEKMQQVKSSFSEIGNKKEVSLNVNTAQINYLKSQINDLTDKIRRIDEGFEVGDVLKYEAQLERLKNQYDSLISKQSQLSNTSKKTNNDIAKGLETMTSKIKRFGMSLLSVRTIYSLISKASSAYLSIDTELANKLKAVWAGLGAMLAPIIEKIVDILAKGVIYINIFIKALTGVDLLARATSKSMKTASKSAKALNKALAGFDELTNLDTEASGGKSGGLEPLKDVEINEDVANFIADIGEKIRLGWAWFTENWQHIALGIAGVVGAILLFKLIKGIISPTKSATEVFKGFFDKLGTAVEIIAILGGLALVIKEITGLITAFAESGLTLGEVAGLLGIILGELAAAFVAVALASKLIDFKGMLGAVIILGGFAIIINQVTNLLEVFKETSLSVTDVVSLLAIILGEIVLAMTAISLLAILLGSNPLALLGILALVLAISAVLLVLKETLPTILDALSKFINSIAPFIIVLIETINKCINETIKSLGEVLPPIISSLGELFTSIFNGISNVVTTVGNTVSNIISSMGNVVTTVLGEIRNIIEQVGNTISQVAGTIIWFINSLGPAIENFTNSLITTVTKVVNFVVSAIEYLANRVVDGVNALSSIVNEVPGVNIGKKSYIYISRFVPSYNVGTNYVPEDQLAMIHKGEAVVPKKFNSREYFGGNNETNERLEELIEAVRAIEINPYTTIKDVGKASLSYINNKSRQLGESVVV